MDKRSSIESDRRLPSCDSSRLRKARFHDIMGFRVPPDGALAVDNRTRDQGPLACVIFCTRIVDVAPR